MISTLERGNDQAAVGAVLTAISGGYEVVGRVQPADAELAATTFPRVSPAQIYNPADFTRSTNPRKDAARALR